MVAKKRKQVNINGYVKSGVLGGAVILVVTLVLSLIVAFLIEKELISAASESLTVGVTQFISFVVGTIVACAGVKEMRIRTAGVAFAVGLLFLLGVSAVFFGCNFEAVGKGILWSLGGAAAGLVVMMLPKKKRGSVKVRYR